MFVRYFAGTTFALSLVSTVFAGVQLAGVNIAGFDFGCTTDGSCVINSVDAPVASEGSGQSDGVGQMVHFTNAHNFNIYRLPVAWQYLVNNVVGGPLDASNFANYDNLVQGCLNTDSYCIIDIHNYARWDGQIIGQGGPTNAQFASLWSQLATKYAIESKVVMGIVNEPHDLPDIDIWAATVQAAVTAIRQAGATSQMILLPGTDYTAAGSFVSSGSAAALAKVTNLDGSTTNLIFDVHQYLDSDGSGTHSSCVTNGISGDFSPLATWLRSAGRMALLSETGGGSSDPTCLTYVCQALAYLDQNSDVYLGYLGWAAGSFATDYVLSLTPFGSASTGWTDQELLTQCFAAQFTGESGSAPIPTTSVGKAFTTTITVAHTSLTAAAITTASSSSTSSSTTSPSPSVPTTTAPSTSTFITSTSTSTSTSILTQPAPPSKPPLSHTSTSTAATKAKSSATTALHQHRHHHTIFHSTFSTVILSAPSPSSTLGAGVGNDGCGVTYVYV